jgi:hypothetical protein
LGWRYISMVEHLPGMQKILGSILSTGTKWMESYICMCVCIHIPLYVYIVFLGWLHTLAIVNTATISMHGEKSL